eukprot:4746181-Amphidinium_carterae.1
MLSGRSTVLCADDSKNAKQIIDRCCSRLGMERSGNEKLVHGTEVLPATARVGTWPGLRPRAEVSEYQLVMGTR